MGLCCFIELAIAADILIIPHDEIPADTDLKPLYLHQQRNSDRMTHEENYS